MGVGGNDGSAVVERVNGGAVGMSELFGAQNFGRCTEAHHVSVNQACLALHRFAGGGLRP